MRISLSRPHDLLRIVLRVLVGEGDQIRSPAASIDNHDRNLQTRTKISRCTRAGRAYGWFFGDVFKDGSDRIRSTLDNDADYRDILLAHMTWSEERTSDREGERDRRVTVK